MTEDEKVDLKPCPFCGGVAHVEYHSLEQTYSPICISSKCQAIIPYVGLTEIEAVAAWNARTAITALPTQSEPVAAPDLVANMAEALQSIFDHFEGRTQAPGHCHDVPGIWDQGNGPDKAGLPCGWCARWNNAREALALYSASRGESA